MNGIDHHADECRFSSEVDGWQAVLDYTLDAGVMTITHTGVPPAIGGRGIAARLMGAAVAMAHTEGWTINPVCSYAVAYLRRHSELASPGERG